MLSARTNAQIVGVCPQLIKTRGKNFPKSQMSTGIYLPPFKLVRLKQEDLDPYCEDAQRLEFERLRKCLKGLVNKVNSSNIKFVVQELLSENLLQGRGLLVRAIIHAQIASPVFSPMFACLVSIINSRIPEIGHLLVRRLLLQFRRAYSRSDEVLLSCVCKFLAHLLNQRVVSESVILQVVTIFLEKLSSDSVKICCQLVLECGVTLTSVSSKGVFFIFERLRQILQENLVDQRVQYIIESLFEARRNKFSQHAAIVPELDLIDAQDRVTHEIDVIDGDIDGEEDLNLFKPIDPETYIEESEKWRAISNEMLGIEEGEEGCEEDEVEEEEIKEEAQKAVEQIADLTEQDMINLKKTIYLAMMSSANFEESVHKILSLNLRQGQEREVVIMLIDSAAMEKTSGQFFHLQAERLCRLSRVYKTFFEESFSFQYEAMHRYETPKIRNIAKMFSHLLCSDAISWEVFRHVRLTEDDTTASTRIFLKVLLQDMSENLGIGSLMERIQDEKYANALSGVFPSDSMANMRFSINFFTAIGLGQLTAEQRHRMNEAILKAEREMKRSPSPFRPAPEQLKEEEEIDVRPKRQRSRSAERSRRRSYSRSVPRENLTIIGHSRSPSRDRHRRRRSESRDRRRHRSRSVDSYGRRTRRGRGSRSPSEHRYRRR